nr:immunoglobulin light chain junction region [Macaca mulatta]
DFYCVIWHNNAWLF